MQIVPPFLVNADGHNAQRSWDNKMLAKYKTRKVINDMQSEINYMLYAIEDKDEMIDDLQYEIDDKDELIKKLRNEIKGLRNAQRSNDD